MTLHATVELDRPTTATFDTWWLVAVGSVMVSVLLASIFSPDMISGAEQVHLPLAPLTLWVWGAAAIGYLSFVRREGADPVFGLSVAILWAAVAATSIFAPELVTGADPTRIPIAALVAPVVGTIVTGFLALNVALRRR
jgi:hypothetical protein